MHVTSPLQRVIDWRASDFILIGPLIVSRHLHTPDEVVRYD